MSVGADPVDTAWRIHSALADWTGKVDAKASFALTIESGVLAGVVAVSGSGDPLGELPAGLALGTYRVGIALLAIAAMAAVGAVMPQTRWRKVQDEASKNYIYFGHLRAWDESDLANAIQRGNVLHVLTRQHIAMSKIAWLKHVLVQASLVLAAVGALLLAASSQLAP